MTGAPHFMQTAGRPSLPGLRLPKIDVRAMPPSQPSLPNIATTAITIRKTVTIFTMSEPVSRPKRTLLYRAQRRFGHPGPHSGADTTEALPERPTLP